MALIDIKCFVYFLNQAQAGVRLVSRNHFRAAKVCLCVCVCVCVCARVRACVHPRGHT